MIVPFPKALNTPFFTTEVTHPAPEPHDLKRIAKWAPSRARSFSLQNRAPAYRYAIKTKGAENGPDTQPVYVTYYSTKKEGTYLVSDYKA